MSGKATAKERYFERERAIIGSTTVDFHGPVLTCGKGVVGKDLAGNEFLDLTGQISLLNTGYTPKEVVSAIRQMANKVPACISADYPYRVVISEPSRKVPRSSLIGRSITIPGKKKEVSRAALAERLIAITSRVMPFKKKRVYFEVSGATAVNVALKIAKITYLRKTGFKTEDLEPFLRARIFIPSNHDCFKFSILGLENAFHGRHGDPQGLTNSKVRQLWAVSSSCAFARLPFPSPKINREEFWKETESVIFNLRNLWPYPIIAFVFEPVQGEGGINVPDAKLLAELVNYLRSRGICIIADEIQSGLGRTGKMWACEHFGIQPDMLCTSKSLGAGLPISAVVVNDEKYPDLEPGMHSGSHHAPPLAVAAAIANIDFIQDQELVESSSICGRYALERLKELTRSCPRIAEVRGLGLMIGIEFAYADDRDKVVRYCEDHGLLLAPAGSKVIRMTPALVITMPQIDKALYNIFKNALDSL